MPHAFQVLRELANSLVSGVMTGQCGVAVALGTVLDVRALERMRTGIFGLVQR
jgi:hypothetical protein